MDNIKLIDTNNNKSKHHNIIIINNKQSWCKNNKKLLIIDSNKPCKDKKRYTIKQAVLDQLVLEEEEEGQPITKL